MTSHRRFRNQLTPSIIDTEYRYCDFSHDSAVDVGSGTYRGTRIFPGDDTARIFFRCKLCNVIVPPGSTVTECNTAIFRRDVLLDTDTVVVDGENVVASEIRGTRSVGKYNDDGTVTEWSSPVDAEVPDATR